MLYCMQFACQSLAFLIQFGFKYHNFNIFPSVYMNIFLHSSEHIQTSSDRFLKCNTTPRKFMIKLKGNALWQETLVIPNFLLREKKLKIKTEQAPKGHVIAFFFFFFSQVRHFGHFGLRDGVFSSQCSDVLESSIKQNGTNYLESWILNFG